MPMPLKYAVTVIRTSWGLLVRPSATWQFLDGAKLTVSQSWAHILVLATIGLFASTLGYSFVGLRTDGFSYHLPLETAIVQFTLALVLGIASVFLMSLWANFLAPRFGATPSGSAALAAIAHAATPMALWFISLIVPALEILWPLALAWTLYVLHLGLGALMKPAKGRHIGYTLSVVAGLVVLYLCLGLLRGCDAKWSALPVDEGLLRQTSQSQSDLANQSAAGQKVPRENTKNGDGKRVPGIAGSSGTGGDLEIPVGDSVAEPQGEPLEGVLYSGNDAPTRSVLEKYLPGDREGMDRQLSPSWAYNNLTAGAAQYLATGAEAKVTFQGKQDKSQYLIVTVTDLTTEKGPLLVDKLLVEIVNTGGERALNGGKGTRTVESLGDRMRVTEYFAERKEGSVELYLAQRYLVRVDARPVTQQSLYEEVEQIDLVDLEQRARDNKPIE